MPNADERFRAALAHLLVHEGGYVDHPSDPGGATAYGCSLRWLRSLGDGPDADRWPDGDVDHDADVDRADVRALTRADAERLYYDHWWSKGFGPSKGFGQLPPGVGEKLFDIAVNAGTTRAAIILQRAIGVPADGRVGAQTMAALHAATVTTPGLSRLMHRLCDEQADFYRRLAAKNPRLRAFLKGWLRRAEYLRPL